MRDDQRRELLYSNSLDLPRYEVENMKIKQTSNYSTSPQPSCSCIVTEILPTPVSRLMHAACMIAMTLFMHSALLYAGWESSSHELACFGRDGEILSDKLADLPRGLSRHKTEEVPSEGVGMKSSRRLHTDLA